MYSDKRTIYILSAAVLAAELVMLFLPSYSTLLGGAVLLVAAILFAVLAKKKCGPSVFTKQLIFLFLVIAAVYLMGYYVTGVYFGFYPSGYVLSAKTVLLGVLPASAIVVCSEIIRSRLLSQKGKVGAVLAFFICMVSCVLAKQSFGTAKNFDQFMEAFGMALIPAFAENVLYQYLCKRHSPAPNIAFRFITTLYVYFIPFAPATPKLLLALYKLAAPLLAFAFVRALYEKEERRANVRKKALPIVAWTLAFVCAASVVALNSGAFRYATLVIGSGSMSGTLERGDVIVYEKNLSRPVEEGDVIVFEKDQMTVVHRVVEIDHVDGQTRYYTKGDANDEMDSGFITSANVVGCVRLTLHYVGYPTLWLRKLVA